jgi:hypothetical protein
MIESQPHSSLEMTIRSLQDVAGRGDLVRLNALGGKTLYQLARENGHDTIAEMLKAS